MRWSLATVVAAALFAAASSAAHAPSLLTASDLDPAQILPPPPPAGSLRAQAELEELRAIERARTPAMLAAAQSDSKTKDASIFARAIGQGFDLSRLPATVQLMDEVRAAERDAADRSKAYFRRDRPWVVAPGLKHCGKDDDADWSSYPSGHATMAYAMGAILARLRPARAQAIMRRAAQYGESRLICEVHFRSDVTAGEALGLVVAERLMQKAAFQRDFATAQSELD